MKCFVCNSPCPTAYLVRVVHWSLNPDVEDTITHVRKQCLACEWSSFPTKVPEKLQ